VFPVCELGFLFVSAGHILVGDITSRILGVVVVLL